MTASNSAAVNLHKSNLLRLQVQELLQESKVALAHVKWYGAAQDYVTQISSLVEGLRVRDVPWDCLQKDKHCPWRPLADRLPKPAAIPAATHLTVTPSGCFQAEGLGMLSVASNANVLPTLELQVQIPTNVLDAKDYLRHRYVDVSSRCYGKFAIWVGLPVMCAEIFLTTRPLSISSACLFATVTLRNATPLSGTWPSS